MRYADSGACTYTEEIVDGVQWYKFRGPCIVTGKMQSVSVKGADLFRYRQGIAVQGAFPYLSANDREFLISGTSAEGWKKIFGK